LFGGWHEGPCACVVDEYVDAGGLLGEVGDGFEVAEVGGDEAGRATVALDGADGLGAAT
jgi:hypothetical protein